MTLPRGCQNRDYNFGPCRSVKHHYFTGLGRGEASAAIYTAGILRVHAGFLHSAAGKRNPGKHRGSDGLGKQVLNLDSRGAESPARGA
jgi:hypothetical protein